MLGVAFWWNMGQGCFEIGGMVYSFVANSLAYLLDTIEKKAHIRTVG